MADESDVSDTGFQQNGGRGAGPEQGADGEPSQRLDVVEQSGGPESARPWLGVWYRCANAYVKVYRSADGTSYTARCPKCGEATRFRVGEGGTSTRFFEIRC